MSSVDIVHGRDGSVIIPVEYAYGLDMANARINALLRAEASEEAS